MCFNRCMGGSRCFDFQINVPIFPIARIFIYRHIGRTPVFRFAIDINGGGDILLGRRIIPSDLQSRFNTV